MSKKCKKLTPEKQHERNQDYFQLFDRDVDATEWEISSEKGANLDFQVKSQETSKASLCQVANNDVKTKCKGPYGQKDVSRAQ